MENGKKKVEGISPKGRITPSKQDNETSSKEGSNSEKRGPEPERKGGTMKAVLVIFIILILIAAPLYYLSVTETGDEDDEGGPQPNLTLAGSSGQMEMTLEELEELGWASGVSSYQNRFGNWGGLGTYEGVPLNVIADHVGGMEPGYIMTITAKDDYQTRLSYYQVYPQDDYEDYIGRIILAYSFNGTLTPEWEVGPMVAVLAPDEAFSNDDYNRTAPRDEGFPSSTSGGSIWVKNVRSIEIEDVYDEWTLDLVDLEGNINTLTRTDVFRLKFFFPGNYTTDDGTYNGVKLSALLGPIEKGEPGTYRDILYTDNYQLHLMASDGYNRSVDIQSIVDGDCILATDLDGATLEGKNHPLKVVGPSLTTGQMVGALTAITLATPEVGDIVLSLMGDTTVEFSMSRLQAMDSYTGSASFKKSTGTVEGPFTYKGVLVADLVDMVYSEEDYSLEVMASDGYTMVYTPSQVNGQFATYVGDDVELRDDLLMLLAYEEVGASELQGGPLRIVLVADDSPVTDGHFWAKDVRTMRMMGLVNEWTVNLTGVEEYTMDRSTFESLASCEFHQTNYTDGNASYAGVPLWILVSAMDGADAPDGHFMFNAQLALAGYNVTVVAGDGFSTTFHSSQIFRNDSIIVAHRMNGEPLPEGAAPLQLVGPGLTGKQKIKNIVDLRMDDIPEIEIWKIDLVGANTVEFDSAQFSALFYCGNHTVLYNDTTKGVQYEGIPLYIFVGAVDDVEKGHYTLNESLMAMGYTVNITAADGFFVTFPISQVAHNDSIILAYTEDGEVLLGDHPTKIVGPNLTGKQKVKDIVKISLEGLPEPAPLWNITLKGLRELEFTSSDFVSLYDSGKFTVYYNYTKDSQEYHYGGIPLWVLVAIVDGMEDDGYSLNQTLVSMGYTVNITALDGFFTTFPISLVAGNDSIIVAYTQNGEIMTGDQPLRLTGEGLTGSQKIRDIVRIELDGI